MEMPPVAGMVVRQGFFCYNAVCLKRADGGGREMAGSAGEETE